MRPSFALLALLSLAGCNDAGKVVADVTGDKIPSQMTAYQGWTKDRNWKAIADSQVVDCRQDSAACGKLHGMRADACLQLAMDARTNKRIACPGTSGEVSAWLSCADTEYAQADPLPGALANRANALYCKAELQTSAAGQSDAVQAERIGASAGNASGLLWAGRGALFQARPSAGDAAARCSAAKRAQEIATKGKRMADVTTTAAFDQLASDTRAVRQKIPGCAS